MTEFRHNTGIIQTTHIQIETFIYLFVSFRRIQTSYILDTNTTHTVHMKRTYMHIHANTCKYSNDCITYRLYVLNTNMVVFGMYLYVSLGTYIQMNQYVLCMYVLKNTCNYKHA
jgi:hypothetical protein